MKKMMLFAVLIALGMSLVACSGSNNPFHRLSKENAEILFYQKSAAMQSTDNPDRDKAQRLADLGETALESPKTAEVALEAFERALDYDNHNLKANFYAGILLPIKVIKGLPIRLKKLVPEETIEDFIEHTKSKRITNKETSELFERMLRGIGDQSVFDQISDAQNFFTEDLIPALVTSKIRLDFVKDNPRFKVVFNFENWSKWSWYRNKSRTVTFDHTDAHAISKSILGARILLTIFSAYHCNAIITLVKKFTAPKYMNKRITAKMFIDEMRKHPKLLTLKPYGWEMLSGSLYELQDTIEGLRIIFNVLHRPKKSRENNFLPKMRTRSFKAAISKIALAAELLAGPMTVPVGSKKASKPREQLLVDATVILASPIRDIKALLPTEFHKQGTYAKTFPDLNFGGTIPNGDFIEKYCSFSDHAHDRNFKFPIYCGEEEEEKPFRIWKRMNKNKR